MKQYFHLLDAVRFFAAFWVMNFHYLMGTEHNPALHWYRFGNLGVQLFFIISGFVIVQSIKGKTLQQFATGRFLRLFPLFWILCTLTYVTMLVFPDPKYTFYFTDYLRSMTMLGDVLNGIIGPATLIDPSYWTLTVELIFYAGIGMFVHLFTYSRIRVFLIGWLALSALAFALHIDENFYVKLLLVRHAAYFVFGSALALLATRDATTSLQRFCDWALLVGSALYATFIHTRALPAYAIPHAWDASIVTTLHIAFFVGVPLLVYFSRLVSRPRTVLALAILGGLTYPLYLLHQRFGNALINLISNSFDYSWLSLVVFFEVFIIIIAYLLYVFDTRVRAWVASHF